MKRSTLLGSVAACICLGLSVPALAAEPAATGAMAQPTSGEKSASATQPATKCLRDLRAFDNQMEKEGYWFGESGYGYGYPMGEAYYGFGYPMSGSNYEMDGNSNAELTAYRNARPGYELRTLLASANILAQHGQQQPCEDVLGTSRDIYKVYVADMRSDKMPMPAMRGWQQQQIAAAQPVASTKITFRSDELVDTSVRSPNNEGLGSIEDLVMNPKTGKIAYLVIARGGIFGIDEKYVPVPWDDFKITPNAKLLVLDATKGALDTAPQATKDQFTTPGHFDPLVQKVDTYWKTHLSDKGKD